MLTQALLIALAASVDAAYLRASESRRLAGHGGDHDDNGSLGGCTNDPDWCGLACRGDCAGDGGKASGGLPLRVRFCVPRTVNGTGQEPARRRRARAAARRWPGAVGA